MLLLMTAAPGGDVVPAKITQQSTGDYQLEYKAKLAGNIMYNPYNDDRNNNNSWSIIRLCFLSLNTVSVSYTHLTLPTKRIV